jgi:aspartate ammonia-lyase
MNYVGEIPDVSYYGANTMSAKERSAVFDKRSVLEAYCQDDVTVLRQACTVFRREFMEIGNVDVFTESVTIASACNKVLRFLRPDTIGLIPTGGYSCNVN